MSRWHEARQGPRSPTLLASLAAGCDGGEKKRERVTGRGLVLWRKDLRC